MNRAIRVELLKFRRSTVVRATTVLVVVLVPVICLGFVVLATSETAGALALKAQALVVGEGWEAYLGLLAQMIAVGTFVGPGVVAAWTFGREHVDKTFPSLFAMPVARETVAAAKFVVLIVWGIALTALVLLVAVAAGLLADVGPLENIDMAEQLGRLFVAGSLTSILATTIGLVASIGRGYLPAFGALILLLMTTQIAVALGTGGWFPYAAPGLYAMAGASGVAEVSVVQLILAPVTALAAAGLTLIWWRGAEVV